MIVDKISGKSKNTAMIETIAQSVANRAALRCGTVQLDTETRELYSERGRIRLRAQTFALAERLMRRPGAIIERSDLISALYENPDDEPETADQVLRQRIMELRYLMEAMGGCRVVTENRIGYAVAGRV